MGRNGVWLEFLVLGLVAFVLVDALARHWGWW